MPSNWNQREGTAYSPTAVPPTAEIGVWEETYEAGGIKEEYQYFTHPEGQQKIKHGWYRSHYPDGRPNQRGHTGAGERSRRARSDMAGGSTSTFTGGIPMKKSGGTENVSSGAKAMRYTARCRCASATTPEGTFHPAERCRPDRSCGLNQVV